MDYAKNQARDVAVKAGCSTVSSAAMISCLQQLSANKLKRLAYQVMTGVWYDWLENGTNAFFGRSLDKWLFGKRKLPYKQSLLFCIYLCIQNFLGGRGRNTRWSLRFKLVFQSTQAERGGTELLDQLKWGLTAKYVSSFEMNTSFSHKRNKFMFGFRDRQQPFPYSTYGTNKKF